MEDYRKAYEEWLNDPYFDEGTRAELKAIENDDKEIRERFYTALEFGTAGLRGIIGAGTNRMNQYVYSVRRRDWLIILSVQADRRRVWQSPTIPDICLRNSQILQR